MKTNKAFTTAKKFCFEVIDGAIITSNDDESLGACCPNCGKPEPLYRQLPDYVGLSEEGQGSNKIEWTLSIGRCGACGCFWFLLVNRIGIRKLICELDKVKAIANRIDEKEVIG